MGQEYCYIQYWKMQSVTASISAGTLMGTLETLVCGLATEILVPVVHKASVLACLLYPLYRGHLP